MKPNSFSKRENFYERVKLYEIDLLMIVLSYIHESETMGKNYHREIFDFFPL